MPTGAQLIVAALERAGVEVVLRPAGRPQPRALGGAARAPRSGSSACATSRPRPTPPTATPARPAGSASRSSRPGPGAANTLGAVGEAWAARSPVLVIATDIPAGAATPGRLPRRAARDDATRRRCSRRWSRRRPAGRPDASRRRSTRRCRGATSAPHAARLPRGADRPAARRRRCRAGARAAGEPRRADAAGARARRRGARRGRSGR